MEVHKNAYHLNIPLKYKLYPIIHVSMLKPFGDQDPRLEKVKPPSDFEVFYKIIGQIADIGGQRINKCYGEEFKVV